MSEPLSRNHSLPILYPPKYLVRKRKRSIKKRFINRRLERLVLQDESKQAIFGLDSDDENFVETLGPGERQRFILKKVKSETGMRCSFPEGGHGLVHGLDAQELD